MLHENAHQMTLAEELQETMDEESKLMQSARDKFPDDEAVCDASNLVELRDALEVLYKSIASAKADNWVQRYAEAANLFVVAKHKIKRRQLQLAA